MKNLLAYQKEKRRGKYNKSGIEGNEE